MGKRVQLSNGRRLVHDVVRIANKMPLAAFQGDFDTGLVSTFRRRTRPKVSWNMLYMKAYSIVCKQNSELRRSYVSLPWGHLYEHENSICMMTFAREHEGEERLFFARFRNASERSLVDLQQQYDYYRHTPVEEIKQFRHQIRFAKCPRLIRSFAWWLMLDIWPRKKANQIGTFGMSISGYKGVYGAQHLGLNTTTLGVDPFPRKGISRIMLTFDHRVIDGTPVTRAMQQLNDTLTTKIKAELAGMIGVNPETGEDLTPTEISAAKSKHRARRIAANRKRDAA